MTYLEVLTEEQRAQLHERTLHVLERTGMRVDSDEGRATEENVLASGNGDAGAGHRLCQTAGLNGSLFSAALV